MSISKFDKCVVIEERIIKGRIEQFYKIINETIDEPELDKMIFATLNNIAFFDYLLGKEVKENKRLNSLLDVVNKRRKTDYQLSDFHIRF
ncbi:hypothetical protein ABEP17_18000 [Priestia flexa]|jgi:hypothetical protein|uniref:Uncharacterized protein n=1 Tax=Priestia flexa TaxID=86664 RepID=A0A8I1MKC3_9BACI|nr:hypothetical protein [Priestia flexa]MBN8253634.1 hypothetical protein [Priestia flexa]MBY6087868.1 hypothetical protein [Priestia flexa]